MIWTVFVGLVLGLIAGVLVLITRESARAQEEAELIRRYWKAREEESRLEEPGREKE